jgi:inorganic phosphate transporter, PiT family
MLSVISTLSLTTIIVIVMALLFDFINGFHDTANAIATSVSTRVLTPRKAILLASIMNFAGALSFEGVAKTIGSGIVDKSMITSEVVLASLIGAIIWNLLTWYIGIPSSSSHALIGGLLGASITYTYSTGAIDFSMFMDKVVKWLFLSPLIGFVLGFTLMIGLEWLLKPMKPTMVGKIFSKLQIASAGLIAFSHGSNDAQKAMGIIVLALLADPASGVTEFHVPLWVKIACALAISLGTSVGGWKIIKTMGSKMARLKPINGFAADTTAALVILTATQLHAPVSTTHIMSTAIMGVGASKRLSNVRWVVAKNIVWAWVLTIPVSMGLSAAVMFIIRSIMH